MLRIVFGILLVLYAAQSFCLTCHHLLSDDQSNIKFKYNNLSVLDRNEIDFNHFFSLESQELQPSHLEQMKRIQLVSAKNIDTKTLDFTQNLIYGGLNVKNNETGEQYFIIGNTLLESSPAIAPYNRGKYAYRFDPAGNIIRKISISEYYIEKLSGENIVLFRGLSIEEFKLWESADLESLFNKGNLKINFGFNEPVLHFSVSQVASGWRDKKFIQLQLPKSYLLDLVKNEEVFVGIHPTLLELVFKKSTWPMLVDRFMEVEK